MPALDGVRILDMTQYEAGTSCTQALAWLGADVVKVEPPSGDPGRDFTGGRRSATRRTSSTGTATSAASPSTSRLAEGRDLLLSMAPHYDAFVENYGPGRMEKLGIDYEALRAVNPRIIYGRVKGFGLSGPWKDYKCFDPIAQAAAGAFSVAGEAGRTADVAGHDHGRRGHRPDDGALDPGGLHPGPAHRRGPDDRGLDAGGDDLLHAHARRRGGRLGAGRRRALEQHCPPDDGALPLCAGRRQRLDHPDRRSRRSTGMPS